MMLWMNLMKIYTYTLLYFVVQIVSTHAKCISETAEEFENNCYELISTAMNWNQAQEYCMRFNGKRSLAKVSSHSVLSFLNSLTTGEIREVWLGATDQLQEGNWVWTDGTKADLTSMWNSKEPNNLNGNEHCLESNGHGKLNDMDCSASLSFICMEVHETSQKFKTTPSTTKMTQSTIKMTPSTTKMTPSTIKIIPSTSKMISSTIKMTPSTTKITTSTIKTTPSINTTSTPMASATEVNTDNNVTKAEMFSNYTLDSTSQKPTVIDEKESNDKFIQPTLVTFTVGLSKQLDVLLHDVIVYNKVVSNVGDDYNNSTGVFRCNMAGLYFFQIYGVAGEGKELSLSLVKNKKKVTSLYSSRNQELSLAANSAVLLLEAGDDVFVEASNCGSLYGEEHHVINTFSGFLLDASIA